jgi:hypothetical protein
VEFMDLKDGDADFEGASEGDGLESLSCLRLAIAAMHARKRHFPLIKHRYPIDRALLLRVVIDFSCFSLCVFASRALSMDIVKVFLLKSSQSEVLLINNIPFSEEHYVQIENTIGADLLCDLDVVFRTLRLLGAESWTSELCRKGIMSSPWEGDDSNEP